jgi:hypothetical protein
LVTSLTLSPPFMAEVNESLASLVPDEDVLVHPAVRILGTLDRIIDELE